MPKSAPGQASLTVRLTKEEHAQVKAKAEKLSMSISDFVRFVCLNAEAKVYLREEKTMTDTTLLEAIFDACTWERKFEYKVPADSITRTFRNGQEAELEAYLEQNAEETEEYCRGIWIGNDSLGTVVCITEEE